MTQVRTNNHTGDVPVPAAIALLVAVYGFVECGIKRGSRHGAGCVDSAVV